jgi:hypothetical protein
MIPTIYEIQEYQKTLWREAEQYRRVYLALQNREGPHTKASWLSLTTLWDWLIGAKPLQGREGSAVFPQR